MRERLLPSERAISEVLTDIVGNVQEMVRFEIRLARSELREQLRGARATAILIVTAVMAVSWCVFFLLLALFSALTQVMPPWGAGVAIAAGLALLAAITGALGARRAREGAGEAKQRVRRGAAQIKETMQWPKAATK